MTAPSCVPASSSALPWALDSDAHDGRKLPLCHSSNSIEYISRPIRAKLFSIASAPASTTAPPLQVFTSPLPAAPGCSMPRCQDLVPVFLHTCLPRDRELLLRRSACPATNVPTKRAVGCYFASPSCSCLHRNFHCLQLLHRILWCSFLLL